MGDGPAHQALTDAVNAGQLLVNYSGHGSTRLWGSNGELLTNDDVPAWTNGATLPFVVAMNCLNGLFSNTYGEDSLAEALLRAPQGGAVAVWASSSLTPAATQALVNEELFRLIFAGTYATVGEAVAMAKRVVASQDLRRSWIFFGDPAMRLRGAPQAPTLRTLGAPPAITTQPQGAPIAAGQQAALTVIATSTVAARLPVVRPHQPDHDESDCRGDREPLHHAARRRTRSATWCACRTPPARPSPQSP